MTTIHCLTCQFSVSTSCWKLQSPKQHLQSPLKHDFISLPYWLNFRFRLLEFSAPTSLSLKQNLITLDIAWSDPLLIYHWSTLSVFLQDHYMSFQTPLNHFVFVWTANYSHHPQSAYLPYHHYLPYRQY